MRDGGYRLQDMLNRYVTLFGQVLDAAETGRYRRPRGRISPPPWLPWTGYLPAPVRRMARRIRGQGA